MNLHDANTPPRTSSQDALDWSPSFYNPNVVNNTFRDFYDQITADTLRAGMDRMRGVPPVPMAAGRVERNPWTGADPLAWSDAEWRRYYQNDWLGYRPVSMVEPDLEAARHLFDAARRRIAEGVHEAHLNEWYSDSIRVSSDVTRETRARAGAPGDAGPVRLREHQIDVRVRISEV